jgi:hypothetical protein
MRMLLATLLLCPLLVAAPGGGPPPPDIYQGWDEEYSSLTADPEIISVSLALYRNEDASYDVFVTVHFKGQPNNLYGVSLNVYGATGDPLYLAGKNEWTGIAVDPSPAGLGTARLEKLNWNPPAGMVGTSWWVELAPGATVVDWTEPYWIDFP